MSTFRATTPNACGVVLASAKGRALAADVPAEANASVLAWLGVEQMKLSPGGASAFVRCDAGDVLVVRLD
ncbi:MAG: hypothetical protein ACYDCK_00270 [Thermoplasmatota archaeon]